MIIYVLNFVERIVSTVGIASIIATTVAAAIVSLIVIARITGGFIRFMPQKHPLPIAVFVIMCLIYTASISLFLYIMILRGAST